MARPGVRNQEEAQGSWRLWEGCLSGICLQLHLRGIRGVCCPLEESERAASLAEGEWMLACGEWKSMVSACSVLCLTVSTLELGQNQKMKLKNDFGEPFVKLTVL